MAEGQTASTGATMDDTWSKWNTELELSQKQKGAKDWVTKGRKIVKRYRDERGDIANDATSGSDVSSTGGSRFNILWSNVQTLKPALFTKSPKPVVERRYLDRDDVGRTASVILERTLNYELDDGLYHAAIGRAVLDRLLPGRGTVWVRYEPRFTPIPEKTQVAKEDAPAEPPEDEEAEETGDGNDIDAEKDEEGGEVREEVASESVPVDYIDWTDFFHSAARTWQEVWWVAKRVYMTRKELVKRFPGVGAEVPLDWSPNDGTQAGSSQPPNTGDDEHKRARVMEIWDKSNRKVYWIAEKWSDKMLDEKDDPLKLEDFFSMPKPLFATLTNESLVPVPDFWEYQDQALELDDLTSRISSLTKAIKACGVVDASVPELQRMFEEGFENRLVPTDQMAEFSQKAGPTGMGVIWMLPIADLAKVLVQLYDARDRVKQVLYEITGISDIVRGQAAEGGAKTATEQRIKGQFASMRLNEMQGEVARFCRDTLRIMGEIIAEQFDPMTLFMVSGFEQYAKEQWPPEPPMPNPMMGHNGPPPGPLPTTAAPPPAVGAPGGAPVSLSASGMLPPDPMMVARQKAAENFTAAIKLLKDEKLRGFRVEIETDSLIEADQQETQQARTALLQAISQFLPEAIQAGAQVPELKPLMARLMMFFLRGFKASRDIESAFEQFEADVAKAAQNPQPKPPSPEQIKADAEKQKAIMEMQRQQAQAAIDRQAQQDQAAYAQAEFQRRMQEMQLQEDIAAADHRRQMELAAVKGLSEVHSTRLDMQAAEHVANLDADAREHQHGLTLEAQEAKAEAARAAPKSNGSAKK